MLKKTLFLVVFSFVFIIAGCTSQEDTTRIEIEETYHELFVNESKQINLDVITELEEYTIEYSSLNSDVVSVNQNGFIEALSPGSTNVRVQVGKTSETIIVVVRSIPEPEPPVPTIVGIQEPSNRYTVAFNTSEADVLAELPETIVLNDSLGGEESVNLTWAIDDYSPDKSPNEARYFEATGRFMLPDGFEGDIAQTITAVIVVEPSASVLALEAINLNPNEASLETYIGAGLRDVSENNINALKAALMVEKNTVYNPGWSLDDLQTILNEIVYNGITWNMSFTIDDVGLIQSLDLTSSSRNLSFDRNEIKPTLLEFFSLNNDLISNQQATFEIQSTPDPMLMRINYLELSNDNRFNQDILIIPDHSDFNNLTLNGSNEDYFADILVGANNVTLKNFQKINVVAHANAKSLNLENISLLNGSFVNDINVNLDEVTLENSLSFNPYKSVNYSNFSDSTLLYELSYSDFALLLPLLINSPDEYVGTPLGFIFNTYLIENDLYGDPFNSDNFEKLLANQQFKNISEIAEFLNTLIDTYDSVENDSDNNFDEDIIDDLYLIPTVNSMVIARNHLVSTIESRYGQNSLSRLQYMTKKILPRAYLYELNQNIKNLPLISLNGKLTMGESAHLIGRFDNLELQSNVDTSTLNINQGSYLTNFNIGDGIDLDLNSKINVNPFSDFTYSLKEFNTYIDAREVILENGVIREDIDDSADTYLLLSGDFTGSASDLNANIDAIYVGIEPAFKVSKSTLDNRFDHPGEASLMGLDINNNNIYVYGQNNAINTSELQDLTVYDDAFNIDNLVLSSVTFVNGSTLDINDARVTWNQITLGGNHTVEIDGVLNITEEVVIPKTSTNQPIYDLTLNDSGTETILGLDNIRFDTIGIPIVGNILDINLLGTALDYQWVYVTEAGIVNEFDSATNPTFLLTTGMIDWIPSVQISNTSQELVGEFTPIDADEWNATQSFVTYLTEQDTVTASASNVRIRVDLRTKNGYATETSKTYNIQLKDGSTTWANLTESFITFDTFKANITEAKKFDALELLINGTPVDIVPEFTVIPNTPSSISFVESSLPRMGASTSKILNALVTDLYGNGVPGVTVSFSSIGTTLDLDRNTRFDEERIETNSSGIASNILRVDPVALSRQNAFDVFAEINNTSASFINVDIVQNIGDASELIGEDEFTVSAGTIFTIPLALNDTKGIPQAVTNVGVDILLVDGDIEDGVVVATYSALNFTSTTSGAVYAITKAATYDLNVYVETYEDSGSYVLIDNIDLEIVPLEPHQILGTLPDNSNVPFPILANSNLAFELVDIYGNPIENADINIVLSNQTSADTFLEIESSNVTSTNVQTNELGAFDLSLIVGIDESFSNTPIVLDLSVSGTSVDYVNRFDVVNRISEVFTEFDDGPISEELIADEENIAFDIYFRNPLEDAIVGGDYLVQLKLTDGTTIAGILSGNNLTRNAVFTITDNALPLDNVSLEILLYPGASEYRVIDDNLDFEILSNTVSSITLNYELSETIDMRVDNEESYTFTVRAEDEYGNPIPDYEVSAVLIGRLSPDTLVVRGREDDFIHLETNEEGLASFTIEIGEDEPIGNILTLRVEGSEKFDPQSIDLYNGFDVPEPE